MHFSPPKPRQPDSIFPIVRVTDLIPKQAGTLAIKGPAERESGGREKGRFCARPPAAFSPSQTHPFMWSHGNGANQPGDGERGWGRKGGGGIGGYGEQGCLWESGVGGGSGGCGYVGGCMGLLFGLAILQPLPSRPTSIGKKKQDQLPPHPLPCPVTWQHWPMPTSAKHTNTNTRHRGMHGQGFHWHEEKSFFFLPDSHGLGQIQLSGGGRGLIFSFSCFSFPIFPLFFREWRTELPYACISPLHRL